MGAAAGTPLTLQQYAPPPRYRYTPYPTAIPPRYLQDTTICPPGLTGGILLYPVGLTRGIGTPLTPRQYPPLVSTGYNNMRYAPHPTIPPPPAVSTGACAADERATRRRHRRGVTRVQGGVGEWDASRVATPSLRASLGRRAVCGRTEQRRPSVSKRYKTNVRMYGGVCLLLQQRSKKK